jgi:hypothetical protein
MEIKAIGFKLLVVSLCTISKEGEHIRVFGDNCRVVKGWLVERAQCQ